MDENAKRRLVGAAVLVAMMVIFVPMLVDRKDDPEFGEPIVIPDPPEMIGRFDQSREPDPDAFSLPLPPPESASVGGSDLDLRPSPLGEVRVENTAPQRQSPASVARPPANPRPPVEPAAPAVRPAKGPARVPDGVQSWVVQAASLTEGQAAKSLQNRLRKNGYPAFIEKAVISGATYYRVRVGPEVDRSRADDMATAIGKEFGGTPLVQQYR